MTTPQTTLWQLVVDYTTIRRVSRGAEYLLKHTVILFSEHVGRGAVVADLTDDAVSQWLACLESTTSAWTRLGHRTRLLSLWRFAVRRKLIEPPGEVRREPPPEPQPDSWTPEEVAKLLAAAKRLGGEEGAWFWCTIAVAYESGLRRGDLRRLQKEQIQPDGIIRIRQHKTGWPHTPRIRPETAACVLSLPGDPPLDCPYGCRKYTRLWRELRKSAGIREDGGCQRLRRTGATWVAVENGIDAARKFLGHRTSEMVRHYVDRGRLADDHPIPPAPPTQE